MVADPQAPAQLTDAQQGALPGNLHEKHYTIIRQ